MNKARQAILLTLLVIGLAIPATAAENNDIIEYQSPDVDVYECPASQVNQEFTENLCEGDNDYIVTGTTFLQNDGFSSEEFLIEMQVNQQSDIFTAFNAVEGEQTVCDEDFPTNVNKKITLDEGEKQSTTLAVGVNSEETTSYDVKFYTATDCVGQGGEISQPYDYEDSYETAVALPENSETTIPFTSVDVPSSWAKGMIALLAIFVGFGLATARNKLN